MKKILLLEDEHTIGSIYAAKLEKYGYTVVWVRTAEDAKNALQDCIADIVLIDHGIRGQECSGLDILPVIRKKLPDAKIIMLSNYSQTDMEKSALKAGADAYLIKINYPPKVLIQYLKSLFR